MKDKELKIDWMIAVNNNFFKFFEHIEQITEPCI